jgi:hypothetical protein
MAVILDLASVILWNDLVCLELRFLHMVDSVPKLNTISVEVEDVSVVVVFDVDLQHYARVSGTLASLTDSRIAAVHVAKCVQIAV